MGTGKPESGWTGDLIGIIALSRLDFGIRDKLRGFVAKTDPSLHLKMGARWRRAKSQIGSYGQWVPGCAGLQEPE